MTNIQLFFLSIFTSCVTIISYKGYAQKCGWKIGKLYDSDISFIKIVALVFMASSFIGSIFYIKWYIVLGGSIIAWLFSGAITAIFRFHTQWISILMLILSFIFLIL